MVAVAIGGAAILGAGATAYAGSKAAKAGKKGAQAAADASTHATELQVEEARRQYDETRSDYAPYREAGYGALDKLQDMYGITPRSANGTTISTSNATPWGDGTDKGAYQSIAEKAPGGVNWGAFVNDNPGFKAQWEAQTPDLASFNGDINKFGAFSYENDLKNTGKARDLSSYRTDGVQHKKMLDGGTTPRNQVGAGWAASEEAAWHNGSANQPGNGGGPAIRANNGSSIPGPDYSDIGNEPDYSDIGTAPDYSGIGPAPTYHTPNYNNFTESPGYKFRLQRGLDAVKANASARGLLRSTATMKNIDRFAEGSAAQEYDAFYNRATAAADNEYARNRSAYDTDYNRTTSAYDAAYNRKTAAFDSRYNRITSGYDAYANRLAAMAGVGQSATGQTATAGSQTSQSIANAYGANGTNQANAAMSAANATASAYTNLGSSINNGATNLASLYLYQNRGGGFGGGGGGFGGGGGLGPPIVRT